MDENILSREEREAFVADGFLGPFKVYDQAEAKEVGKKIRIQTQNKEHAPFPTADINYDRHIDVPALTQHISHPAIVKRLQSLIGPDVILWGSQVFCKPATIGMEVPWHQDGEYWPIRPLATCSVWIAIDDVSIANGAMRYIPGSHRARRLFPHVVSDRAVLALNRVLDPTCYDAAAAAYDELASGQISLHDVYLIHGSAANTSGMRRAGFAIRYMPATSTFDRLLDMGAGSKHFATQFATRPIYLMRGAAYSNSANVIDCRPHQEIK